MNSCIHKVVDPTEQEGNFAGLRVPSEFYWVARQPTILAGMQFPSRVSWDQLHAAGIHRVVCLSGHTEYSHAPLERYVVTLEDLYGGRKPSRENEEQLVVEAASLVQQALERDQGVVVHCDGGTGRTGTVLGVTLVLSGFAPGWVVTYLDRLHRTRGRAGWPESPWQEQVVRGAANRSSPTT